MSFLAGICYRDTRPISPSDYRQIHRLLRGRLEGLCLYEAPGLLMACATDACRSFDRFALPCGDHIATAFDGRLDNRKSLAGGAQGDSDAGIAGRLYQSAGVSGLGRLVGDWSLATYSERDQELVLASDYAGIRPLYYHEDSARITWSTCPRTLAECLGITELSKEFASSILTSCAIYDLTAFHGIVSVPSGHAVVVRRGRSRLVRIWEVPVDSPLRYATEGEYEENFRSLFEEAVACRLASPTLTGAELSGGLDSSSVVAVASRLIQRGAVASTGLVTFSYHAPGLSDERFYSEMERRFPLRPIHINLDRTPFLTADDPGYAAPTWWEPRNREVARLLSEHGASTLLTGRIGDLIMANWADDSEQVADYLLGGRLGSALSEAYAWSRSLQKPVYPILWRALTRALATSPAVGVDETSLTPEFLRSGEAFRPAVPVWWGNALPAARKRFQSLGGLLEHRSLQVPGSFGAAMMSHPFAHRPLVEFMLRIPPGITCRPNEPRRLMRRALSDILPKSIAQRRSKATYDGVFLQSLRPLAQTLLQAPEEMSLVRRGIVERDHVTKRLHRLVNGLECNEGQLRHIVLFEHWLKAWEQPNHDGGSHHEEARLPNQPGAKVNLVGAAN